MPYYDFKCTGKCKKVFEKTFSFKEFDEIKAGNIKVLCEKCNSPAKMALGGENVFIYMADPRTLGSLADRNSKYRIPQEEEKEERKREEKIKAGKYVPPKEINVPWDEPEKPKIDMKERKEKRKEANAKKGRKK